MRLRWSPTGKIFDIKGKITASSESNGYLNMFMMRRLGLFQAYDRESEASHQLRLEVLGNRSLWACGTTSVGQFCDSDLEVVFLRSKYKAPEEIKTFLKRITVLLQALVIIVRTDNGTEFKNQELQEYFKSVGISHQASSVCTPQQNRVVERRNRMLVEAARTMLIFSCASLFLWAEATATACYTQNRSIIYRQFDKTPYELINDRKPDISFLHVFGALCYPKNNCKDIRKLGAKGDIGFFIGYSTNSCAYRVYNQRTKKIIETINVTFDELSAMYFEQSNLKPRLQSMTSGQISSGLDLPYAPSTITTQRPTKGELDLLFEAMYDDHIGGQPSAAPRTVLEQRSSVVALELSKGANSLQAEGLDLFSKSIQHAATKNHMILSYDVLIIQVKS
ncbi:integrase, catalytic region, zinc finger, CCHC-type containing protein [Tanacetum coccineum]